MSEIEDLYQELKEAKKNLQAAEEKIRQIQLNCKHDWAEAYAELLYTNTTSGVISINRKVINEEENRWKRSCKMCHKEESTERYRKVPYFDPPITITYAPIEGIQTIGTGRIYY